LNYKSKNRFKRGIIFRSSKIIFFPKSSTSIIMQVIVWWYGSWDPN